MNTTISLEEFDCKLGSDTAQRWNDWLSRFQRLCGLQKYDYNQKFEALFLFGGQKLYKTYEKQEEDIEKEKVTRYDIAIIRLSNHFKSQKNAAVEISKFHRAKQNFKETIENYVERLKELAENCEFGGLKDTLIKNHVINTCISKEFRRVLLRKSDIDLEDLVNIGRSYDIADE